MSLIKQLPFKVGDEIKNYKEMCRLLGEKEREGNSRKSQLSRWKEHFDWEKNGHKFKITKVLNASFPTHDDNMVGHSVKRTERKMSFINTDKNYCLLMERHMWDKNFSIVYWAFIDHWEEIAPKMSYDSLKRIFYESYGYKRYLTKMTAHSYSMYLKSYEFPRKETEYLELLRAKHGATSEVRKIKVLKYSLKKKSQYYLYKFINRQGIVVYVGRTTDLQSRLYTHFNNGHLPQQCYEQTVMITYLPVETEMLMTIMEIYFIAKYYPKYNTMQKIDDYTPIPEWNKLQWTVLSQNGKIELPFSYRKSCKLN